MSSDREWMRSVDQQLRELHQRTADLPVRLKPGGGGTGDSGPAEGTYVPLETATTPEGLNTAVADYTLGFVTEGTYAYGWFCLVGGEYVGLNVWRSA